MNRRTLIRWAMSASAWLPFHKMGLGSQATAGLSPDSRALLREIAVAVLPTSLGATQAHQVADRFAVWLRDYKPGAEMEHGYGFTRLRTTPASPASGYG